ncbi:MAG: septum formation initiator family protein [Candidatus Pacebacteria bacterium]|nr:septum formation initiator family protein [Candidatus Paceibacterota bacterium]
MVIRKRKKSFRKKVFSFKLFVTISVFVVIFLGIKLGGIYYIEYQIQKEINSLQNDIDSVKKNNYKLSQLIEYSKTDEFKEAEARKRLNVQGEGEKMVIIKPSPDSTEDYDLQKKLDENDNLANYIKWWNYFFDNK